MKLFNEQFEVSFTTLGGEMTSFKDKVNDIEYLWQGDAKYWSGKNPTLFPIVGNTFDTTYQIDGKTYQFKNHGLIRYAQLQCTKQSDTSITFTLQSNEETKKAYPFDFTYNITYTLNDNRLDIAYLICNDGDTIMPFTFGLHPGFKCPIGNDENFEDYTIEFEKEEHFKQIVFDVNKEKPHTLEDVVIKSLPLNYDYFEKYATLIYKGVTSSYVTLFSDAHALRVGVEGYPLLALWTPSKGAPFVCIEPWYSHADFEKTNCSFEKREGMMSLNSQETFETSYYIEIV